MTTSNNKAFTGHLTPMDLVLVCEKMLSGDKLRQIEEHCAGCELCRWHFERFNDIGPDDKAREVLSPCFAAVRLLKDIQRDSKKREDVVHRRIERHALPCTSGADQGPSIPPEMLQNLGLPKNTKVVCHNRPDGYKIFLLASVSYALTLEFYKGEKFLHRVTITDELPSPDNYVPYDAIAGWTEVRVLREEGAK